VIRLEIKDRISYVISESGLKRIDFAKRIDISPASVSQLCAGITKPSNQTIASICREFGVDRIWLETGVGEPFRPVDRNEQIAAILGRAIVNNDTARDRLIRAFCQLPDELFPYAEKILYELVDNLKKEKPE
jgi:transcriptional regulator with XRE-family HTH domain